WSVTSPTRACTPSGRSRCLALVPRLRVNTSIPLANANRTQDVLMVPEPPMNNTFSFAASFSNKRSPSVVGCGQRVSGARVPVLVVVLGETDQHVLVADPERFQPRDDGLEQGAFLLHRIAGDHDDPDHQQALPVDSAVAGVEPQLTRPVRMEDLEAIIG